MEMSTQKYRQKYSFQERADIAAALRKRYPEKIPIIVEPYSKVEPSLSKTSFLVGTDATLIELILAVRKHLPPRSAEESLFFFVGSNERIFPVTVTVGSMLKEIDSDGILYIVYRKEDVFGTVLDGHRPRKLDGDV